MYRGVSDITEVFALLNRRLTGGEVGDVRQSLHAGLRDLWPE